MRITVLQRRSRLAFFPAYVVDYAYGEVFNVHGERVPERFQAIISGTGACPRGNE